jgi:hypothetical protein
MRDAQHNRNLIPASAASPDVAQCPACGGEVRKRKRTDSGSTTWFYRHRTGPDDCPRRYRPVADG